MNRTPLRWLCPGAIAVAMLAACKFDPPSSRPDAPPPDPGPCLAASASCASDTVLRTCAAEGASPVETACVWGCVSSGTAHCGELEPAGGVLTAADFDPSQLLDVTLASTTIDTDDGEILGVRDDVTGLDAGIDFQKRGMAAVLRVKSLRITGTVLLRGGRALAIVAQDAIVIEGIIDGRGDRICDDSGKIAGPGGSDGGSSKTTAPGLGGGTGTTTILSGGGGGGHGAAGGPGAGAAGAAGGMPFGTSEIMALVGGGGGGGGGSGNNSGTGGGGGAAIQLASGTSIAIAATGGINAGGCGGDRGEGGNDGGGGGGAGGTILLEAPTIAIAGALAVNGGGGGTRLGNGAHATLDRTPAAGGTPETASDGTGGVGGTGAQLAGGTGTGGTGGGGGGAVGRMRFHTRTGVTAVETGAVLSPALDDSPTTTTQRKARVK